MTVEARQDGILISVEGLPVCGKTKQVVSLFNWLCDQGLEAIGCKTLGGTALGRELRFLIYERPDIRRKISMYAETFIMLSDLSQLYDEVVLPCLRHNKFIVLQEGGLSTILAMQSIYPQNALFLESEGKIAIQGRKPDITIFLDCSVGTLQNRAAQYGFPYHYTGSELTMMRDSFYLQAQDDQTTIRIVNGENELEAIKEDILFIVKPLLRERQYLD